MDKLKAVQRRHEAKIKKAGNDAEREMLRRMKMINMMRADAAMMHKALKKKDK